MGSLNTNTEPGSKSTEIKGGMVLYPIEYCINQADESSSYFVARTTSGQVCIVYLIMASNLSLSEDAIAPSVFELSRTDRNAKRSCIAHPDNNHTNPAGVLLAEQVKPLPASEPLHGGMPCYSCAWISVLREDDRCPMPAIGVGFMETNYVYTLTPEVQNITEEHAELSAHINSGAAEISGESILHLQNRLQMLCDKALDMRKKYFSAVIFRFNDFQSFGGDQADRMLEHIKMSLIKYTREGMYGGVYIRVRVKGSVIVRNLCISESVRYKAAESRIEDVEEVISRLKKAGLNRLISYAAKNHEACIDVMPAVRINCGKHGIAMYSKQFTHSPENVITTPKVLKTYVQKEAHSNPLANYSRDMSYLCSKIAIRLATTIKGVDAGNKLVSAIHAYSPTMGSIWELDRKGVGSYKLTD